MSAIEVKWERLDIRTISNDGLGYDECIFENEETGKRT
jgi:hypothetical protein